MKEEEIISFTNTNFPQIDAVTAALGIDSLAENFSAVHVVYDQLGDLCINRDLIFEGYDGFGRIGEDLRYTQFKIGCRRV